MYFVLLQDQTSRFKRINQTTLLGSFYFCPAVLNLYRTASVGIIMVQCSVLTRLILLAVDKQHVKVIPVATNSIDAPLDLQMRLWVCSHGWLCECVLFISLLFVFAFCMHVCCIDLHPICNQRVLTYVCGESWKWIHS